MWSEIPNTKGVYEVSKSGDIRRGERILKPQKSTSGYLYFVCCIDGLKKNTFIHRAVMMAFTDEEEWKDCVNHIDGNKKNNNISNLEWVTYKENALHSIHILGNKKPPSWKGKTGKNHNRSKTVIIKNLLGETMEFGSSLEMKRHLGFSSSCISLYQNKTPYKFKKGNLKGYELIYYG